MIRQRTESPEGILIHPPYPTLRKGDIVFSRGAGAVGGLIRLFTSDIIHGEPISQVSHTGVIVKGGTDRAEIAEARAARGVLVHPFYEEYKDQYFCVIRDVTLHEWDRHLIAAKAESFRGHDYTERTLFYQMLGIDKWLAKRFGDRWRICSWLTGVSYEEYKQYYFDVDYKTATPDDQFDYCMIRMGRQFQFVVPPTWLPNNWPPEFHVNINETSLLDGES